VLQSEAIAETKLSTSDDVDAHEVVDAVTAKLGGEGVWISTFTAADKITYQGYVWTQTKPRAYPWISHGELSFPAEYFATVSATIRTQESDVFAGLDVWLPYWLIVAVTSIWPAIVLNAIRKSRRDSKRAASQLCTRCGYDLRATPLRCPECGKETEPKSST